MELTTIAIVWVIQGDDCRFLYETKEQAETIAAVLYPDETAERRYARISCRELVRVR